MSCGMWESLVPWPGAGLRPRKWKHWVLTTEPPGNAWNVIETSHCIGSLGINTRWKRFFSRFCRHCSIYYLLASVKSAVIWLPVLCKYSSPALSEDLHPLLNLIFWNIMMFHGVIYFHCVTGYSLSSFNVKLKYLCSGKILIPFLNILVTFTLFFVLALQWFTYWTS